VFIKKLKDKVMDAKVLVLEAMKKAGEPVNVNKIVELTGLDKKEVDKAMKQLKDEGAIESPKRCYWQAK
jgi:DNA-binding IscR family transcriptional regulator